MAAVAPSPEKAAELIQNLSLDAEAKTTGVLGSAKRNGPALSTASANGITKPFYPNSSFVPNGYSSAAYYYGGYDGQCNDWNAYNGYVNLDGGMAQGVYGDSPYVYHQGYGYTPYGAYPTPGSAPTIQHDGQLYGLQQYQYPSYYQSTVSADGSFASNEQSVTQRELPNAATDNRTPSSVVMNKGNTVNTVNGEYTDNNGFGALLTSSKNPSQNSKDFYPRASLPAYVPLPGSQDPRFSTNNTQSVVPSDSLLLSDRQSNDGVRGKDFTSRRNPNLSQPLPHFMNLQDFRPLSGMELFSGYTNRMYPGNRMYSQYGNSFRSSSRNGSAAYRSKTGYADNSPKAFGNLGGSGGGGYARRNMDGINEMNKGPRSKSSDNKNDDTQAPVTLLLKGQNLPTNDNKEVPLVANKEQYNGQDLSENYSEARFFVIKSYSEDDVHKSIKYSVWASTPNGNKKLNAAHEEAKEKSVGRPVFLLFSVNTSGQFVGLAEMVGPVDFDTTVEYWQQDRWTGCFPVKWHIVKDIPNVALRHITLENNENKPVTNSRDTQEVNFEKGIQILNIFKEHTGKTCILDDFEFYEAREKIMLERKSKEQHQGLKHVSIINDPVTNETTKLSKSLGGTLNQSASAAADVAAEQVNGKITSELEDSSRPTRAPNGVASNC